MRETFKAYVAGLFDGEGYVRVNKQKSRAKFSQNPNYQLFTGMNMCDPEGIKLISEAFGGNIYTYLKQRKVGHRPTHYWYINSKKALYFLETIRPYLTVKADQADLAIEFQHHMNDYPHLYLKGKRGRWESIPENIIAYRDDLFQRISLLKRIHKPLA